VLLQDIGAVHLRALAALPWLTAVHLNCLRWAQGADKLGFGWLAARLPRLRILNAPPELLVRPSSKQSLPMCFSGMQRYACVSTNMTERSGVAHASEVLAVAAEEHYRPANRGCSLLQLRSAAVALRLRGNVTV
jgi:hypothetical protein